MNLIRTAVRKLLSMNMMQQVSVVALFPLVCFAVKNKTNPMARKMVSQARQPCDGLLVVTCDEGGLARVAAQCSDCSGHVQGHISLLGLQSSAVEVPGTNH